MNAHTRKQGIRVHYLANLGGWWRTLPLLPLSCTAGTVVVLVTPRLRQAWGFKSLRRHPPERPCDVFEGPAGLVGP
jgi:hypothetical protein